MLGNKSNIIYCKTFGSISRILVEKWGEGNGKENFHLTTSPNAKVEEAALQQIPNSLFTNHPIIPYCTL